jgi:hypothetical protein
MRSVLTIFLIMVALASWAGNRYTCSVTSAGMTMDGAGNGNNHSLTHGDTLDVPANGHYTDVSMQNVNGVLGDSIVIRWLAGSYISTTNQYSGIWTNNSFVKVIGLTSHNLAGTPIWMYGGNHDLRITGSSFTNDFGGYSEQPAIIIDDQFTSNSIFTGSKSQTFYNIRIDGANFGGFQNTLVCRFGAGSKRSICLDFEFDHNNIINLTATGGVAPTWVEYNGFGGSCHDNWCDSMLVNAGASQTTHDPVFSGYGYWNYYNNKLTNSYAQLYRIVPLQFTGLAGYRGYNVITNSLLSWSESYSLCEISPDNGGARWAGYGGYVTWSDSTYIYNCMIFHSKRASHNGDYAGMICDLYPNNSGNQSTYSLPTYVGHIFVHNNTAVEPEADRTFDAATRGYIIYYGAGVGNLVIDSGHNRVFQFRAAVGWVDTIGFRLTNTSPLLNGGITPLRTKDFYNIDLGLAVGPIGSGRNNSNVPRVIKSQNRFVKNKP